MCLLVIEDDVGQPDVLGRDVQLCDPWIKKEHSKESLSESSKVYFYSGTHLRTPPAPIVIYGPATPN